MTTTKPLTPWDNAPQVIACNFAYGHLVRALPNAVAVDGRIHAETYMVAVGAIAGYAARRTLFASMPEAGRDGLKVVTSATGRKYWFGDALNFMLVPRNDDEAERCVWSMAAGGAVGAGLPQDQLPDLGAMFGHVSQALGSEREGFASVPAEHQPHAPAFDVLKRVWPLAVQLFDNPMPAGPPEIGKAPVEWWAAIAARAANKPIVDVKDVLAPAITLTLVMESAIYCSKLDPADVEG